MVLWVLLTERGERKDERRLGGSEREGVRDPAFWARKAEKAEVRGVAGPSATGLGPTMQTPADFPWGERDSLPYPRKVSGGLACLQSCLSP